MELPFGMGAATLEQRKQFYTKFKINKAQEWVGRPLVYAVIIGRRTNLYPERFRDDKDIPLIIDSYRSLADVQRSILDFLPEGVYYDRNHYKDLSLCHAHDLRDSWNWENFAGQQLAFDFDPENVTCPIHGALQERLNKGLGLSFCETAFEITRNNTIDLYEKLTESYSDIRIVFSGRGFHLHIFDKDAQCLSREERERIAENYKDYGIDTWVTTGEMRLIRLPYTLNGISSRIVTPLDKARILTFNPQVDAIPSFK
ncbi:MAG TPA: DNA primase small subunit domain-containing protein [Candidatus Thermoplasmatota archaeon]|nr:DNA primase small subunit domain-containing protein [Candidatus Thermoplasmatota archaeon]